MAPRADRARCHCSGSNMTGKKFEQVSLTWFLIGMAIVLVFLSALVEASGVDVRQSNDLNNQTSGNVVTEGSTALGLGFSYGMGDVDINDCLVSTQSGNIIFGKQGFEYNLWCMGEVYDAKGLYRMGALMRCDIPAVRIHFTDDSSCLAANEVGREVAEVAPVLDSLYEQASRHEETEEQHEEELEQMQMQQAEIVNRMDSYDRQRRRAAEAERQYNAEFLEKFKEVASE